MSAAGDETDMERGGVDSEPAPQSRTQNLSRQINEVMDTLKGNINRLLQRHENLADLLNKTEEMKDGADQFKKTSDKVARSYWWKNAKLIVVLLVVVLIVVVIIVLLATGVIPTSAPRDFYSPSHHH
ncbi:vesicle-associated membrane protein 8-like [Sparus aurata]|uniref:vesicle-associated membrane protein 8-like n=1 Tax=Sparus aurata TaxID=8175 RepID=UPI0011C16A27|nr:vesicle-associated membrane protein 8-like [Sparus aurata]